MKHIKDYIALLRPRYHLLYSTVIFAAYFFGSLSFTETTIVLLVLYFSFCVFLYGGLYTINAIGDRVIDAAHPRKKDRPVASGRVHHMAATLYAFLLLSAALLSGYLLFGTSTVQIYLAFIAINILYTYVLKHIPYLELIGNSVTYPLRALLGITVTAGTAPLSLYVAVFFFAMGWATTRRLIEKERREESGRPVLRRYAMWQLHAVNIAIAIVLLGLWLFSASEFAYWYALFIAMHLFTAFLRLYVTPVRKIVFWLLR